MERKTILILTALMLICSFGITFADDDAEAKQKNRQAKIDEIRRSRPERGRRAVEEGKNLGSGRGRMHQQQLKQIEKRIGEQRAEHDAAVNELNEIRQLALEEKATKTAQRIQQMVDRKNGKFQESIRHLEKTRERIREQIQKQEKIRKELQQGQATEDDKTKGKKKGAGQGKSGGKGRGKK